MSRNLKKILWADDEIEHLKSHILFLREKGYDVTPVTNAEDAISLVRTTDFDLLLLDEMMPGLDGLEALNTVKSIDPSLPVIMITKSEEEDLMEQAIGRKIEDYLTKPVNPSQILSSCKRILDRKRIARDNITRDYTSEFAEITAVLEGPMSLDTWADIHLKLSERFIDLDEHKDLGLHQTMDDLRVECNHNFARYIAKNYSTWVNSKDRPVLSPDIVKTYVLPELDKGENVLLIIVDNLRLDQWLYIEPSLYDSVKIERTMYCSILPSATPYSRNSIFSGLFPNDMKRLYPEYWEQGSGDEHSWNQHEREFLEKQLQREKISVKGNTQYVKIITRDEADHALANFKNIINNQMIALVFNFVDIVAHRRNDSEIIHEIVPDESAYRSLTRTWFEHSSLKKIISTAVEHGFKVVLTSDHGSTQVKRGTTVYADKHTSTNLRYKYGKSIRAEGKNVINIDNPGNYALPDTGLNTNYLIATEDMFFVYPTNYHKYISLFKNSFQHGGVSLEEMLLPVIVMTAK